MIYTLSVRREDANPTIPTYRDRKKRKVKVVEDYYTVFDTGTLVASLIFFSVSRGAGACGVAKEIYEQFCFSNFGLCCLF